MAFLGRIQELAQLKSLLQPGKTSLVVVSGRRRIGKSALVQEFAKSFKNFYEFQGLSPGKKVNNQAQLKNFAELIKVQFAVAEPVLHSWTEAMEALHQLLKKKAALIFFDELSWMGKYDPTFVGKLKIAWDTKFSKIPNLVLVLCGSVSSWIEDNILQSTDFVGRVSLTLRLKELDLKNSINFWGRKSEQVSLLERLSYLCVAGAVPKYLEEYDISQPLVTNIKRLCFTPGGFLYEDFEKVFGEVFEKKSADYKAITRLIASERLSAEGIASKLKIHSSGDFLRSLRNLELSGFISRDYVYRPGGKQGKLSRFRISDNFLRFYLKYIDLHKSKIQEGLYEFSSLSSLLAWDSILGLQFENLILNRLPEVLQALKLDYQQIISASSYFQRKTSKTKPCQIDLLIECKRSNFYICEIKFQKLVTSKVIKDVQEKIKALSLPKYSSRRPVLIYAGELEHKIIESDFFDKILNVQELLVG